MLKIETGEELANELATATQTVAVQHDPAAGQSGGETIDVDYSDPVGLHAAICRVHPFGEILRFEDIIDACRRGQGLALLQLMKPGVEPHFDAVSSAAVALRKWESEKANMKSFKQAFVGDNVFKPGEDFMKRLAEKSMGAEGMTVAGPPLIGGLTTGSLLMAGIGLGIGLLFHALSPWRKVESAEKNSPYRYLTMMDEAGVVFTLSSQRTLPI
jgi:hypothetical protein